MIDVEVPFCMVMIRLPSASAFVFIFLSRVAKTSVVSASEAIARAPV
jgi:hypothetical protein